MRDVELEGEVATLRSLVLDLKSTGQDLTEATPTADASTEKFEEKLSDGNELTTTSTTDDPETLERRLAELQSIKNTVEGAQVFICIYLFPLLIDFLYRFIPHCLSKPQVKQKRKKKTMKGNKEKKITERKKEEERKKKEEEKAGIGKDINDGFQIRKRINKQRKKRLKKKKKNKETRKNKKPIRK